MTPANASVAAGEIVTNDNHHRHIVLIGGGEKPPGALRFFLEKTRKTGPARILVVGWASVEFPESLAELQEDFAAADTEKLGFELLPSQVPPRSPEERQQLVDSLHRANAVFFCGGDQTLLMDGFHSSTTKEAFLEAYAQGKIFGGTSAGTAIMSSRMIYGHDTLDRVDGTAVWIRDGLGILPTSILDQHFFRRQRQNRLLGAVNEYPCHLAIGVDEDASLLVTDERHAEVIGGQVMVIDGSVGAEPLVLVLNCGDRYDLKERRR